jgi:type I restriction enzyme S subunit
MEWGLERFGDVCDFVRGPFGGSLKKSIFKPDGHAVYEQQHAIYDQFEDIRYFIDEEKFSEMSRFELKPNDLIMSCSGTMGKIAIVPNGIKQGIINQALLKLTPKDALLSEFLKLWMDSPDFQQQIEAISQGAAIKNMASVKILKEIKVPVPKVSEQQRIVAILDQAFADIEKARANAERNLKNAHELFDSYLNQVFSQRGEGWVTTTLESVCKTTQGIQIPKSGQFNEHRQGLRRYLYISDFKTDKSLKYVKDCHPNKLVSENDLVVVNTGNSAGDIFYGINGVLSNNLFKVSFDSSIFVKEYLYHFINSGLFKKHQIGIRKGTANPHMGHENFKSTPFRYPLFYQQQEICKNLDRFSDKINQLESKYHEKLASLDELKKSLLQKAFSGELTQSKGIAV